MTNVSRMEFVETLEYRRFEEFCNTCRYRRYIGVCYGPPGVGKTLSARHYAAWSRTECCQEARVARSGISLKSIFANNVVFYTVKVVTSPGKIRDDINRMRQSLHYEILNDIREDRDARLADVREREQKQKAAFNEHHSTVPDARAFSRTHPTFEEVVDVYAKREKEVRDPTNLIFIDEADRLKMTALDQVRELYDNGGTGVILIGMPGIEKRLARYPQFYSRVGFVHQFCPLTETDLGILFGKGWRPPGVRLPENAFYDKEGVAAILRVTGGNFRLLHRLLTQVERILEINELQRITPDVIDAARESLVIGVN